MVDAPIVKRVEYTLLNIDEEQLELLSATGEMKSDVDVNLMKLGGRSICSTYSTRDSKEEGSSIWLDKDEDCCALFGGRLSEEKNYPS